MVHQATREPRVTYAGRGAGQEGAQRIWVAAAAAHQPNGRGKAPANLGALPPHTRCPPILPRTTGGLLPGRMATGAVPVRAWATPHLPAAALLTGRQHARHAPQIATDRGEAVASAGERARLVPDTTPPTRLPRCRPSTVPRPSRRAASGHPLGALNERADPCRQERVETRRLAPARAQRQAARVTKKSATRVQR